MKIRKYKEQRELAYKFISNLRDKEYEKAFSILKTVTRPENYFWAELWNYTKPQKDTKFFEGFLRKNQYENIYEIYWVLLHSIWNVCEENYQKALEYLLEIQSKEPNNVTLYDSLGRIYIYLEEFDKAKEAWERALLLMPNNAFVINGLGLDYFNINSDQRINQFLKAIELEPEYVYPYDNLAMTYLEVGKNDLSLKYFFIAIKLDPHYTSLNSLFHNMGVLYRKNKKYQEAINSYTKALEIDNSFSFSYKERGETYFLLKEYEKAKTDFDQYLQVNPEDKQTFSRLQDIYKLLNKAKNGNETSDKDIFETFKNPYFYINSESSTPYFEKQLQELLNHGLNLTQDLEQADCAIFIQPYDYRISFEEIKPIIDEIEKRNIPFQFYLMDEEFPLPVKFQGKQNPEDVNNIIHSIQRVYGKNINIFSSIQVLQKDIRSFLSSKPIMLRIIGLELENIGLFQKEKFLFDKKTSVLIGTNGTGKTTILRALALSLIGSNHRTISEDSIKNLWNVKQWLLDKNQKGIIKVQYEINNKKFENSIEYTKEDATGQVFISSKNTDTLFHDSFLRIPIIGFGQQRKLLSSGRKKKELEEINPASINDVINLITNSEDDRLHSFVSWIANLKNESLKTGRENKEKLIHLAFNILSQITKEVFRFQEIKTIDPLDVWIITQESPEGIPIEYASQGCQTVMGWVGYIIERMYEAYPYSSNFQYEPAIVIIDEIDSFLHPKWQKTILTALQKNFPNIQIIASTHSPIVVDGLEKNQIIQLSYNEKDKKIKAERNPVDIWSWSYEDILLKLFNVSREPKVYEELLLRKIETLKNKSFLTGTEKSDLEIYQEQLDRLEESRIFKDELAQEKKRLREQEQELKKLMEEYQKESN